ncbi:MauE/DoxX family redox-associated membrane protein [Streptomyces monashensis]|uniref:MauE/DoxX family redox-associated membrane protein n=1 Tax=Streptomyces monashensis TaxID=1678012 RepID=UPI0033D2C76D
MELTQAFGKMLLSSVFVLSATSKLRDFNGFRTHLASIIPVTSAITYTLTGGAISAEFLITLTLWVDRTVHLAFLLALLLLTAFSVFIAYLLVSNKRVSCACFGASTRPVSVVHLGRNIALLLIAGICMVASRGSASPAMFDYLLVLAPALVSAAIVARLDDISTFFSSPSSESFKP